MLNMSCIKIVIPARYGSSRLEGKPLLEIIGKPIFWHVYQRCLEAGFDDQKEQNNGKKSR